MDIFVVLRRDNEAPVQLRDGTLFYDKVDVHVTNKGWPLLTLSLGVQDGRVVLNRLAIDRDTGPAGNEYRGPEFGSADLRKIPLERVVREAAARVAEFASRRAGQAELSDRAARAAVDTRRRRALTNELLERVSTIVRDNPDAPTRAVEEQLYTSYRNASRWIAEARRRREHSETGRKK